MLTTVLAGLSRVDSVLLKFISISVFTGLDFAMLCSGTTINNGGKTKRSNIDLRLYQRTREIILIIK